MYKKVEYSIAFKDKYDIMCISVWELLIYFSVKGRFAQ